MKGLSSDVAKLNELIGSPIGETDQGDTDEAVDAPEGGGPSVPTSSNTKAEIAAFLDHEGIAYDSSATKTELLALVP
jgi:hypothetical protein